MLDIGWSEMFVILLVALIVIGPKDLPRVARTVGKWVGKGRALAREFQNSIEDMAREAELDDVKKEIERAGRTDFKKSIENTIDPKGELKGAFDPNTRRASSKPGKPKPAGTKASGTKANAAEPAGRTSTAETGTKSEPAGEVAGPPPPDAAGTQAQTSQREDEPERVAAGSS